MHLNTLKKLISQANAEKRMYLVEDSNFTIVIRSINNYQEVFFKSSYKADLDVVVNDWVKGLKKATPAITFKDIPLKVDANGVAHIKNATGVLDSRMQRMQSYTFSEKDVVGSYKEILKLDISSSLKQENGELYYTHTVRTEHKKLLKTVWTPGKVLVTFFILGTTDEDILLNPLFSV
jgi:type II secretory pathway component PulC